MKNKMRTYLDLLNEDAGPPMTIIVHNSGTGSQKKATQVFNTVVKLDRSNRPQLWFAYAEGEQPQYYADYTQEGWVADMD